MAGDDGQDRPPQLTSPAPLCAPDARLRGATTVLVVSASHAEGTRSGPPTLRRPRRGLTLSLRGSGVGSVLMGWNVRAIFGYFAEDRRGPRRCCGWRHMLYAAVLTRVPRLPLNAGPLPTTPNRSTPRMPGR